MNSEDLSRLDALLADRATGDLEWNGYRELGSLAENEPLPLDMDLAAAALHLALAPEEEAMPNVLRSKIAATAQAVRGVPKPQPFRRQPSQEVETPAKKSSGLVLMSWLAAAASLAFAFWMWQQNQPLPAVDIATLRADFQTQGQNVQTLPWSATEDPSATGASGDVVWSNTEQKGYMRISGLEANNPTALQYQLWIFDADRENPVDGGVFDIPAGATEVIVPINAKLAVNKPQLFAITVEKPGGVVVSKKERIVLVADPTTAG